MAFNADAMVEALTPPAFVAGGRTYTGRILSVEEWVHLHAAKDAMARDLDKLTVEEVRNVERGFVCAWFPAPLWHPGRYLPKANPAWRAFKRLPEKVQHAAIADFSECQRKALPDLVDAGLPADTMKAPSPPPATT